MAFNLEVPASVWQWCFPIVLHGCQEIFRLFLFALSFVFLSWYFICTSPQSTNSSSCGNLTFECEWMFHRASSSQNLPILVLIALLYYVNIFLLTPSCTPFDKEGRRNTKKVAALNRSLLNILHWNSATWSWVFP